ncbi:unnamed protein product [Lymnaea stagnalis]|uniref:Uncharacterized protein n=1 Tax=Lymnaea stagnalis TaxID=6523 RepID=A0AAV2HGP1_LYMST
MAAMTKIVLLFLIGYVGSVSAQETNPCKYVKNGVAAHLTTCSKYYQCNNNRGNIRSCRRSENFNPKTKTCVRASQYECPITTTTATTTTTEPTTIATTTLRTAAPCSPQEENLKRFTLYEFKGSSYFISHDFYTSANAAAQMCETICGYLAEVDNQEEEDRMHSIVGRHNVTAILIGGTDKYREGFWEFARNRRPVTYLHWHEGEPNDALHYEDCMCIMKGWVGMIDCACTPMYLPVKFVCEV